MMRKTRKMRKWINKRKSSKHHVSYFLPHLLSQPFNRSLEIWFLGSLFLMCYLLSHNTCVSSLLLLKYLVEVLTNLYLVSLAIDTIFNHSPVVGIVIFTELFFPLIPGHTLPGYLLISLTVLSLFYCIVYFLSFSISKSSMSILDVSFCSHSSLHIPTFLLFKKYPHAFRSS